MFPFSILLMRADILIQPLYYARVFWVMEGIAGKMGAVGLGKRACWSWDAACTGSPAPGSEPRPRPATLRYTGSKPTDQPAGHRRKGRHGIRIHRRAARVHEQEGLRHHPAQRVHAPHLNRMPRAGQLVSVASPDRVAAHLRHQGDCHPDGQRVHRVQQPGVR